MYLLGIVTNWTRSLEGSGGNPKRRKEDTLLGKGGINYVNQDV